MPSGWSLFSSLTRVVMLSRYLVSTSRIASSIVLPVAYNGSRTYATSDSFRKRERAEEERAAREHDKEMLKLLRQQMEEMDKETKKDREEIKAKEAARLKAEQEKEVRISLSF